MVTEEKKQPEQPKLDTHGMWDEGNVHNGPLTMGQMNAHDTLANSAHTTSASSPEALQHEEEAVNKVISQGVNNNLVMDEMLAQMPPHMRQYGQQVGERTLLQYGRDPKETAAQRDERIAKEAAQIRDAVLAGAGVAGAVGMGGLLAGEALEKSVDGIGPGGKPTPQQTKTDSPVNVTVGELNQIDWQLTDNHFQAFGQQIAGLPSGTILKIDSAGRSAIPYIEGYELISHKNDGPSIDYAVAQGTARAMQIADVSGKAIGIGGRGA